MKWFGDSWGAPVCDPEEQIPIPLGEACEHCKVAFRQGDQGLTMPFVISATEWRPASFHLDCLYLRIVPVY